MPGFETIGYDDWFSQCENEFKEKLLKLVSDEGLKIIKTTDSVIMFKTIEHIETVDNTKSTTGIEIIISFEQDELNNETEGRWRVTQEKFLSDDELTHDKNHGLNQEITKISRRNYIHVRLTAHA